MRVGNSRKRGGEVEGGYDVCSLEVLLDGALEVTEGGGGDEGGGGREGGFRVE